MRLSEIPKLLSPAFMALKSTLKADGMEDIGPEATISELNMHSSSHVRRRPDGVLEKDHMAIK